MLPKWLYSKDVPGLDEAILAQDYCSISGEELHVVIGGIKSRRLLGVFHNGVWYVEAPPFCEDALDKLHKSTRTNRENQQSSSEQSDDHKRSHQGPIQQSDITESEKKFGRILGLKGRVTLEDVKQKYRELSKQYHPDKVQSLGPKLREVAEDEMKAINEAYDYFRTKYKR